MSIHTFTFQNNFDYMRHSSLNSSQAPDLDTLQGSHGLYYKSVLSTEETSYFELFQIPMFSLYQSRNVVSLSVNQK